MLLEFRFGNYKSFSDETILDMRATNVTENIDWIMRDGELKVLRKAIIMGANASGKSNVIEAFRFMKMLVSPKVVAVESESGFNNIPIFLFDEKYVNSPSIFEVTYINQVLGDKKIYRYGFSMVSGRVEEEWLYEQAPDSKKSKVLFIRSKDENKSKYSSLGKEAESTLKDIDPQGNTLVSLSGNIKSDTVLKGVWKWFESISFINYGNPKENVLIERTIPRKLYLDSRYREKVVKFLSSFDPAIKALDVEEDDSDPRIPPENRSCQIFSIHMGEDGKKYRIPFRWESAGTQKMFALYFAAEEALRRGNLLIIDELDSKLHPLLWRGVMLSFSNPSTNLNGAQLICTMHDPWVLNMQMARRDEIWFTEKNFDESSVLYSLVQFRTKSGKKIRKDEDFMKSYLMGKYGAIPDLARFDFGMDNIEAE